MYTLPVVYEKDIYVTLTTPLLSHSLWLLCYWPAYAISFAIYNGSWQL